MSFVVRTQPYRRRARMPWTLRRARRVLFYLLVRAGAALVRRTPAAGSRGFLRGLATLAWWVLPRERRIMRQQLADAFPADPADVRDRLARRSLSALADNLVDMMRADVEVRIGAEARERLHGLSNDSRGTVLLMAHHGAWELVGGVLVEALPPFAALTASPHNRRIGEWLRARRRDQGIVSFDRDQDIRAAARWLRDGGSLAILSDHRTRGSQVRARWFGRWVPTMTGAARLAKMGNARIVPVGIHRVESAHEIEVGPAFEASGDPRRDARRCNAVLEEIILRSPTGWTWFHDRSGSESR